MQSYHPRLRVGVFGQALIRLFHHKERNPEPGQQKALHSAEQRWRGPQGEEGNG